MPPAVLSPAVSKFRSTQLQQTSTLMRLPFEIRERIYWMLLGGKLLHIDDVPKDGFRMCHCVCQQLSKEELRQHLSFYYDQDSSHLYGSERPHMHIKCRPWENKLEMQWLDLRVLRACQQMYHEALPTLWGTNTFSFAKNSVFSEFLFGKTAEQRQMIRNVRFDISELSSLTEWLEDLLYRLVDFTKENTLHVTVSIKKRHARNWPHPGWCNLAKYILGMDLYLYLLPAEFNIEVENNYGGISVITAEEIMQQLRLRR